MKVWWYTKDGGIYNLNTKNRLFWCRGYYVDTVGKNAIAIRKYIDNQLRADRMTEQLTFDKIDPFTGSKK